MGDAKLSKHHPATERAYGKEWAEMMYAADKDAEQPIQDLFEVRITDEDTVEFTSAAKGIEKWNETATFAIKEGTDAWNGKKQSWPVRGDKTWKSEVTARAASDWWTRRRR